MDSRKHFKVVIVGGSLAGLTLAIMLQKTGIDFILLEAHPDIAPQVGASIGFMPHGSRILDQLGIYEELRKLIHPLDQFNFRDRNGKLLAAHRGVADSCIERHGYPLLFMPRQTALQVLYDQIEDKSKILTGNRVSKIDINETTVTVTTKAGGSYTGDIVVGADGVHSAVRQEMWRLANASCPGFIPATETSAMPCDYSCIFGISNPCKGIEPGSLHDVFRDHSSYMVLGGLGGMVYWFYYFNIGKRVHAPNIPRYSKAYEQKLMDERASDHILPDLTFGDLCNAKISSSMTALPAYVFKKWHFGRIITIGDAAHKFEPIAGHGGNAAIETSATLVNGLVKALKNSQSSTLSDLQISNVFETVQTIREKRTETIMAASHSQHMFEALETPLLKFLALYMLPRAETGEILFNASKLVPQSQKLDMISLPVRPKLIPYDDELLRRPRPRGWFFWAAAICYLALSAIGFWHMHIAPSQVAFPQQMEMTVQGCAFAYDGAHLKCDYTGVTAIDNLLTFLVAAFMPGVAGWNKPFQILQIYFLISLFPVIAVWSIEACRKRNSLALISFTSLWSGVYQVMGFAIIAPLYYLAYLYTSNDETYWWPLSREVPLKYARTLLPSLLCGYLLPTLLMFWPWSSPQTTQIMIAVWQPSPIYVNLLLIGLSRFHSKKESQHAAPRSARERPDITYLKLVYAVCFSVSLALHLSTIILLLSTISELSLRAIMPLSFDSHSVSLTEGLRYIWAWDFLIGFVATIAWCLLAQWDLRRVGKTNATIGQAAAVTLLALICLGPGATISACWYWRELAMARTVFK